MFPHKDDEWIVDNFLYTLDKLLIFTSSGHTSFIGSDDLYEVLLRLK